MSWNVNLRLNNLQQQINTIANKGLVNPLEENLDANGFQLINLNLLDGKSNALLLHSDSGISTNTGLEVQGNISCNKLTYQSLSPIPSANLQEVLETGDDAGGNNIINLGELKFIPTNGILNLSNVAVQQLSNLSCENGITISQPLASQNAELGLFNTDNYFKIVNEFNGGFSLSDIDYTFLQTQKGNNQTIIPTLNNNTILTIGSENYFTPQIRFNYDGGSASSKKYILVCYNDLYQIQQFDETNTDINRPLTIDSTNSITLKSDALIYSDMQGNTGNVLTTMDLNEQITQIYNGVSSVYSVSAVVSNILSIPLTQKNGLNYVSLLFNNISITCTNQNLSPGTQATIYLASANLAGYDSTKSFNPIVYTINNNNGVFNSSIPIEMTFIDNNINTIYLIIAINQISLTPYDISFNANILLKGLPLTITTNSINIHPSG